MDVLNASVPLNTEEQQSLTRKYTMTKKTVKAWAIIWDGKFWSAHRTREDAKKEPSNPYDKIVPCTITFEVPKQS